MKKTSSETVKEIYIAEIDGPEQDQRLKINQDEIQELAQSIEEVGLQQPILLTPKGSRYEVVWGHRRFLATKFLGKTKILAKVQVLTKSQKKILRATENLHRLDISPIEEAIIYNDLKTNEKMTLEEIGQRMRKSPGLVRRRIDLLRMPEVLQTAIHSGRIKYGVAEELWSLGDQAAIEYYLQFAVEHGATVTVVRGWVKDEKDKIRRQASDIGGGGESIAFSENKPVYAPCDLCSGPLEVGTETPIRACPNCVKELKQAMESHNTK